MQVDVATGKELKCFHCGNACEETLWAEEKAFCCYGCKTVFEILSANELCEYYSLDENPGLSLRNRDDDTYAYLDEAEIRRKIVTFDVNNYVRVIFYIPAIHCVSCIWLLENLQKLNKGILKSEVNFARKSVQVDFTGSETRLSEVAQLLASLGYPPKINLENEADAIDTTRKTDRSLIMKLTIAGFCFGNVMLFSFPEYLGLDASDQILQRIFSFLNIALSIPVLFYSGSDYFRASLRSIRERQINIDVPIAVGLLALFFRSTWDILSGYGPGYLDSFTGLVFFLLVGRWFQSKTYESLAFDRDFKSYFPLAVHKLVESSWKPVIIYNLRKGDQIRVRNMEIVPADCILLDQSALIDYSFVTGESKPVKVEQGQQIYAGGRLIGQPVTLAVEKKTSQSHLTSLWNNDVFSKAGESKYRKLIDRAARRFTWVVLMIAIVTAGYWYVTDPSQMWLIVTAVLMVACPCALALAAPFTYGSMVRVFGRNHFYLKNADIIERLAAINTVVFDKTGTVTHGTTPGVTFVGDLPDEDANAVYTLTGCSTHPMSNLLHRHLRSSAMQSVHQFHEIPGKGIEGFVGEKFYRIGSAVFAGVNPGEDKITSRVYVSVDGTPRGYYSILTTIRPQLKEMLTRLGNRAWSLLSGDNESDRDRMQELFGNNVELHFNQTPHDKMRYIRSLQNNGRKVMMVGDGLNDSGAIKQSDAGIAVTDDTGVFTPACDGILRGDKIGSLDKFIDLAKSSAVILKTGFVISFMYNAIALSFAVSGHLTPLVAAILMPISSISVVGFTSFAVNFAAKRKKL